MTPCRAGVLIVTALCGWPLLAAGMGPRAADREEASKGGLRAGERNFVIRAKAVYPVTADNFGPIENGMVVVRDGRIVAVGVNLEVPADLPLIEFRDETIVPGFVNAASGMAGAHTGVESIAGAYDAFDAFDTYSDHELAVSRGTTTVHIDPGGHRLVTGCGAVVKLGGPPAERLLLHQADLTVNLGVYGPPNLWELTFYASADEAIQPSRRQRPHSRLGQYVGLEYAVADAMARIAGTKPPDAKYDMQARAFADAWAADLPLRIQARRAADVDGAIAFLKRHHRRGYLVGLTEAGSVHEALSAAGIPIVYRVEEAYTRPAGDVGPSPDALEANLRAAGQLAGLRVALAGTEGDPHEDLGMVAALAMRGGMSRREALEGITRVAAEIIGVGERVGSLAPGKDADLLVLAGRPLDVDSHVRRVYVNGRVAFEPPGADSLVVKGGTVWLGNGNVIQDGAVLVEDGKIHAVGNRVPEPPFAKVIDAGRDSFIVPGFIDAHGHLGLQGDRQPAAPDLPIAATVGVPGREFRRVARGGVTTVMLAPYAPAANGSRVAAIKTFGETRGDMLVRELGAMEFSLRGRDASVAIDEIRKVLKAGRDYEEKWKKYEADLKKWEDERAKGGGEAKKPEATTETKEEKPDPITGTWPYKVTGIPGWEGDVTGTMLLVLTDNKIEGRIFVRVETEEEAAVSGRLDGESVSLDVEQDTPMGRPRIDARLDRDDHMEGHVVLGEFSAGFGANRTDKTPPELKVTRQRKRGKGGRPEPPKVDENLEPVRQLLAKKIPALVDVESAAQINAAVKLFVDEFKLRLVLLNAEEAALSNGETGAAPADRLAKEKVGVVLPARVMRQKREGPYNEAADLSRRGVPVALQSDAEDGARNLVLTALYGVQQGFGGDAALRALTIDAARMFGVDDRVGSLEAGKDADLLIFTGHPLDAASRLERVIVSGKEVPSDE